MTLGTPVTLLLKLRAEAKQMILLNGCRLSVIFGVEGVTKKIDKPVSTMDLHIGYHILTNMFRSNHVVIVLCY